MSCPELLVAVDDVGRVGALLTEAVAHETVAGAGAASTIKTRSLKNVPTLVQTNQN